MLFYFWKLQEQLVFIKEISRNKDFFFKMKNKLNNFYLLILISYLTLILGFLFNENITSGATDWPHVSK